jgi:hypothetical protein
MKDFYDLWALSRLYDFDGPILLRQSGLRLIIARLRSERGLSA